MWGRWAGLAGGEAHRDALALMRPQLEREVRVEDDVDVAVPAAAGGARVCVSGGAAGEGPGFEAVAHGGGTSSEHVSGGGV